MFATTVKKRDVDLLNLTKLDPFEIFHPLSQICRFSGQCHSFYSVGQHTLNLYNIISEETSDPFILSQALLHDASEAFVSDIITPVKRNLPDYLKLEKQVQSSIYEMFNINPLQHELVSKHDKELGSIEKEYFFNSSHFNDDRFQPMDMTFVKHQLVDKLREHQIEIDIIAKKICA